MRCKLPKSMRPNFCGKSKQHLIAGDALSASERVVGQSSSNTVYDAPKGMSTGAKHSMSNFTDNHELTAGYRGLVDWNKTFKPLLDPVRNRNNVQQHPEWT